MNTPLYYSARVIHDPVNKTYTVYYKHKWYSLQWKYESSYSYYYDSGIQRFEEKKAMDKADALVAKSVVYLVKQDWI